MTLAQQNAAAFPGEVKLGSTTSTFGGALSGKLCAIRSAGFTRTELWSRDLFEYVEGPEIVVDLLRETELGISAYQALRNYEGMTQKVRQQKLGIAEQLMDQMALIGAELLVVCSNTSAESNGDHTHISGDLSRLGDLARSRNIRVAYEGLCWGRWIRDYRDAWKVVDMAGHDNVGLMLDCFHIFALDLPLDDISQIPAKKVFLVEISDMPRTSLDPIEVSRHYRLFPNEGVAPVGEFVKRVRQIGYSGHYSLEVFNAQYRTSDPGTIAKRAMRSLTALFSDSRLP